MKILIGYDGSDGADAAITTAGGLLAGSDVKATVLSVWEPVSVAAVLSRVLDRTITFHPITLEEQKQAMIDVGLPEAVADDNARAVALMADGDCDYLTADVLSILGRAPRSFEQFARDHAAAFSSVRAAA